MSERGGGKKKDQIQNSFLTGKERVKGENKMCGLKGGGKSRAG